MIEGGIVLYKFNYMKTFFLLIVSALRGWGIFSVNYNFFNSFWNVQLQIMGFLKLFTLWFKIKGFGFKFIRLKNGISIKEGFTHRILLLNLRNAKIMYLSKAAFQIKSRDIVKLQFSLAYLLYYYKKIVYKKLGIYLKGIIFKLKLSKKKLKF